MLVYGDRVRRCDPRGALAALAGELQAIAAMPPGLARHAALVGAFIEAGELAQGVADDEHPACDGRGPRSDAAMRAMVALAEAIAASWPGGHAGTLDAALAALAALAAHRLPDAIAARRAEGYAFYAVYPEAYLVAARAAPPAERRVIGIRSIGLGLAALVATGVGAPLPATVRPRGDPFARRLEVDRALVAEWCAGVAQLAIVDEGPGMSGSSFGAVIDALEAAGVAPDRIECFPSHAGALGPAASERHRARWRTMPRHVIDADALLLRDGTLAGWIADLVGPLRGPLEDLSAGRWRAKHFAGEAAWPPVVRAQERRKLLAYSASGAWLARFVGLGRDGERALVRARRLASAGFTPEVAGLCHGFLVERWLAATPLSIADLARSARRHLIERVGCYLGFRARELPADEASGASLARLAEMIDRNAALARGAPAPARWSLGALRGRGRRVEIDGRLHAWEWLVCGGGALVKADAIDHCAAHDLVGCQDIAWDIAGATIELGLDAHEHDRLVAVVGTAAGQPVDRELLGFTRAAYLAFQLGRHALAAECDAAEAPRLRAAAERYAARLVG